jgi:hypothetical protein
MQVIRLTRADTQDRKEERYRMKLSEAMERGAKEIKQIKGHFLQHEGGGEYSGCALGAAAIGRYGIPKSSSEPWLNRRWIDDYLPVQMQLERDYPELFYREVLLETGPQVPLKRCIIDLNDRKGWTFEKIIAYLKTLDL